jgi:alpha-tubulin suppressor-like RCC1 family protein
MLGDGTAADRSRPVCGRRRAPIPPSGPEPFPHLRRDPGQHDLLLGSESLRRRCDGNADPGFRRTPVAVGLRFRQVSTGGAHTCAATTSDVAYCWGGELCWPTRRGTQLQQLTPVKVAGRLRFRQISANGDDTCGVTSTNVTYCGGSSNRGQLGNGTSTGPEICGDLPCSTRPVRVVGRWAFHAVSVGSGHTCALTTKDVAYCWGHDFYGQLGNGTRTAPETCFFRNPCSSTPVRVHAQRPEG